MRRQPDGGAKIDRRSNPATFGHTWRNSYNSDWQRRLVGK